MAAIERAIPVGGAVLNFKVVGGTAEPVGPKENTIWVNTDVEISDWAFSAGEPAAPVRGNVWVKTAATSTVAFNALKKNAIVIYPQSCMQWNGSVWVQREALVYKNGGWANTGIVFISESKTLVAPATYKTSGSATIADNVYTFPSGIKMVAVGWLIDVTDFDTLKLEYTASLGGYVNAHSGVFDPAGVNTTIASQIHANNTANTTSITVHDYVDVSGVTGTYVVGVRVNSGAGGDTATVTMLSAKLY